MQEAGRYCTVLHSTVLSCFGVLLVCGGQKGPGSSRDVMTFTKVLPRYTSQGLAGWFDPAVLRVAKRGWSSADAWPNCVASRDPRASYLFLFHVPSRLNHASASLPQLSDQRKGSSADSQLTLRRALLNPAGQRLPVRHPTALHEIMLN